MDHNDWIAALPGIAALLAVIITYYKNRADAKNAAKKLDAEKKIIDERAEKLDEEKDKVRAEKERINAEAASIIQQAAFDLNEQYKKRMEELEQDSNRRMKALEKSGYTLKRQVMQLEEDIREVLNCLIDVVEGANKLFDQVTKKHKDQPEYTPPTVALIKGRKKAILSKSAEQE